MPMFNTNEILDTIHMIDQQHLDVRTITMGVSLLDCCDPDPEAACRKIYEKIVRSARDLVKTGEDIEAEFGIPIVNKRISVTPMALVAGASRCEDYTPFAVALDKARAETGVNFIGGFSALVQKGMTPADERLIRSLPSALSETELVCGSVNVGSTKAGINMDAVALMGRTIKELAAKTADAAGFGCAKLVVFCNAVEDNPFMAGAFHGVSEPDRVINVGVSGPGVVCHALQSVKGAPFDVVAETVKKTAFRITRMGQLVAQEASRRLDVPFGIVDLSLAPTPAVGDSVARILEEMGLETCGAHGTTAALALLNDAVKKGGVMASSSVGGLSGAFIPVSEDEGMIAAAHSGLLTLDGRLLPWPERGVPSYGLEEMGPYVKIAPYTGKDPYSTSPGMMDASGAWVVEPGPYDLVWPVEGGFYAWTTENWAQWQGYRLDLSGQVAEELGTIDREPEPPGGWDNYTVPDLHSWDGLTVHRHGVAVGAYYVNGDGAAASGLFDWCGAIGPDGRGFVGMGGKVYRIQFEE